MLDEDAKKKKDDEKLNFLAPPAKPASANTENLAAMDAETEEMLKKIAEMQSDLDEKMQNLVELGRSRNIDISKYLSYVTNFDLNEQKEIQRMELELAAKLKKIIPSEACVEKLPKSKEKLSSERRIKTIGSRQKWIPM